MLQVRLVTSAPAHATGHLLVRRSGSPRAGRFPGPRVLDPGNHHWNLLDLCGMPSGWLMEPHETADALGSSAHPLDEGGRFSLSGHVGVARPARWHAATEPWARPAAVLANDSAAAPAAAANPAAAAAAASESRWRHHCIATRSADHRAVEGARTKSEPRQRRPRSGARSEPRAQPRDDRRGVDRSADAPSACACPDCQGARRPHRAVLGDDGARGDGVCWYHS